MRQEHRKVESQDAKYEALTQETERLINKGLSRDVTHELLRQQTSPASIMQVQVPKDQQEGLAKTLEKLVDNPEGVYVTDVTGKHIIVHKGITHSDLAELVCKRGYRLHITPAHSSVCEAAAELAESANGSVLVPGKKAITHGSVASMLQEAIAKGDTEKLQQTVNLLLTGKRNGLELSPSSAGLIASVIGNVEELELTTDAERRNAVQVSWYEHDEIQSRWEEVRRIQMAEQFKQDSAHNFMLEIIPEATISVPKEKQRIIIELEPDQMGEDTELYKNDVKSVEGDIFERFRAAKIAQNRASQLLAEAPESIEDQKQYEATCKLIEEIDTEGNIANKLTEEQMMLLFHDTVIVAREAIERDNKRDSRTHG